MISIWFYSTITQCVVHMQLLVQYPYRLTTNWHTWSTLISIKQRENWPAGRLRNKDRSIQFKGTSYLNHAGVLCNCCTAHPSRWKSIQQRKRRQLCLTCTQIPLNFTWNNQYIFFLNQTHRKYLWTESDIC